MTDYSLTLFDILLKRSCVGIPPGVVSAARDSYTRFRSEESPSRQEIDDALIAFGLEAWPYWQAEEQFEEEFGRVKEKDLFLSALSAELQEKWTRYENDFGNQVTYDHDDAFEGVFSAEENLELERAVVDAKQQVVTYVRSLAAVDKSEAYMQLVAQFSQERDDILQVLSELLLLKEQLPDDMDEEIDAFVRYVKLGFAEVEQRPSVDAVRGKMEFFQSKVI